MWFSSIYKAPSPSSMAVIITAIMLVAICIVAANSLYSDAGQNNQLNKITPSLEATKLTGQKTDYSQLEKFHLFGKVAKQSNKSLKKQIITVPETRLNIELIGVIFDLDTNNGLAIIAVPGKEQKTYHKGETLPGNAKLFALEKGRVILERNSRHEILTLKKPNLESQKAETLPTNNPDVFSKQTPSSTPLPAKLLGKYM